jgi:phosphatidate cytidylyltransferase
MDRTEAIRARLLSVEAAIGDPAVRILALGVLSVLAAGWAVSWALGKSGRVSPALAAELHARCRSWAIIIPAVLVPLLAGALPVIACLAAVALLCYREFARATGLFRERWTSAAVVLSMAMLFACVIDHWYLLFVAVIPFGFIAIATFSIVPDSPEGYLQRVGLGCVAFMLFGVGLGHLAYIANDGAYRAILLWLIVSVQLNDVMAFAVGRLFGRSKLAPGTSPGKTRAGALGALVLTAVTAALTGAFVFRGTPAAHPVHLAMMGLLISALGQLGDLTLSSVKRDLGVKDLGNAIPGHGGFTDRANSLLLVAPALFHYLYRVNDITAKDPTHIVTRFLNP